MKNKGLSLLLAGVLTSGCATHNGSWAGKGNSSEGYQRSSNKLSYAIPARAKKNWGGQTDYTGPVKDFGKGVVSWKVYTPLEMSEWRNNPYFVGGVLVKDLVLIYGAAEGLNSGGDGGKESGSWDWNSSGSSGGDLGSFGSVGAGGGN